MILDLKNSFSTNNIYPLSAEPIRKPQYGFRCPTPGSHWLSKRNWDENYRRVVWKIAGLCLWLPMTRGPQRTAASKILAGFTLDRTLYISGNFQPDQMSRNADKCRIFVINIYCPYTLRNRQTCLFTIPFQGLNKGSPFNLD